MGGGGFDKVQRLSTAGDGYIPFIGGESMVGGTVQQQVSWDGIEGVELLLHSKSNYSYEFYTRVDQSCQENHMLLEDIILLDLLYPSMFHHQQISAKLIGYQNMPKPTKCWCSVNILLLFMLWGLN